MADPPREGGGESPTGGSEEGHPARGGRRRHSGAGVPRGAPGRARLEHGFERALSLSRVVVVIPVVVLVLAAFSSFALGTEVFVRSVTSFVEESHLTAHNLGFLLLLTDLFLVGATLMIAAFGFYDLFVTRIDDGDRSLRLPGWLRMRDLNDLKARVISMIILVAAVTFVDVVVESKDGGLSTFYLGAAVALVIAALTAFLYFGRMDGG